MLTNGHGGMFVAGAALPLGEVECVAIVVAPIDALSLAAVDIPALAFPARQPLQSSDAL
jgi:hypothetical protein